MSIQRNWVRLTGYAIALSAVAGLIPLQAMAEHKISADLAPLLEKAYNEMMKGNYPPAVETLNKAVKTDKESITARRYLAFALVKSGEPRQAIEQLNTITKSIKPTYFEWCTYGEAYLSSGGLDQAESCYKEALKATPKNDYAKSGLIRVSMKGGNFDQALELAEEGMKRSRGNDTYNYFKNLYMSAHLAQSRSGAPARAGAKSGTVVSHSASTPNEPPARQTKDLLKRASAKEAAD